MDACRAPQSKRRPISLFHQYRAGSVWALMAATIPLLTACADAVTREYVWTRPEPALGRKSPTLFVVRIAIDRPARSVQWLLYASDAEGELGSEARTWTDCTFVDDRNWQCPPEYAGDRVVNRIGMRDGVLRQAYWSEERIYKVRRRVAGIAL
jgi:hypothetical protein